MTVLHTTPPNQVRRAVPVAASIRSRSPRTEGLDPLGTNMQENDREYPTIKDLTDWFGEDITMAGLADSAGEEVTA